MENQKRSYTQKLKIVLPIVGMLFFMLLVFGPTEIFYSNISDFEFGLNDFLPMYLGVFIAISLVAGLVLSLFPDKVFEIFVIACFEGAVLLYIQNMFLNPILSNNDGTMLYWDELGKLKVSNLLICLIIVALLLCIILFVRKKQMHYKVMVFSSFFLIAIQLVAFVSLLFSVNITNNNSTAMNLDASNEMKIAPNSNIIILTIDAAEGDLVKEYFENNTEVAKEFADFTYFTNYDSRFWPTFPSVAHLLSGSEPDCSMSKNKWSEEAWNSKRANDFYETLHDNGYTVNVYCDSAKYVFESVTYLDGKIDNVKIVTEHRIDRKLMLSLFTKMSLYRYVPYILKEPFEVDLTHYRDVITYADEDEFIQENVPSYHKICEEGLSINDEYDNLLMYKHFWGMHREYSNDENCEECSGEVTWNQAFSGVLKLVDAYISELKRLDKYEDATIIIMSDHGSGDIMNRQALFMIKMPNSHNDSIVYNDAPVCSDDFQATILEILGCDTSEFGKSVFDWSSTENRTRTTLERSDGLIGYEYTGDLSDLREIAVNGPNVIFDNPSW